MNENREAQAGKKKCRKCKEMIDATARKCPHCQTKNPHTGSLQGCFGLIVLAFILFAVAQVFIPGSDTTKKEVIKESAGESNTKTKTEETAAGINNPDPDFIPFEYLKVKEKRDIKMRADVLVQLPATGLPTKKQLSATGAQVVSYHDAENNFVLFYLPGMYQETGTQGPYATYSYYRSKDKSKLAIHTMNLPRKYIQQQIPGPARYSSIEEMVESGLGSGYDWQIYIQGKNPPHLKLTQAVFHETFKNDPEMVWKVAQKGIVFGIFKTFIHTDIDKIKVTSVPFVQQKLHDQSGPEADNYKIAAELTRAQALDLLDRALKINSFDQLVGAEYAGVVDPDAMSIAFKRIYYNSGIPGRVKFVAAIMEMQ